MVVAALYGSKEGSDGLMTLCVYWTGLKSKGTLAMQIVLRYLRHGQIRLLFSIPSKQQMDKYIYSHWSSKAYLDVRFQVSWAMPCHVFQCEKANCSTGAIPCHSSLLGK